MRFADTEQTTLLFGGSARKSRPIAETLLRDAPGSINEAIALKMSVSKNPQERVVKERHTLQRKCEPFIARKKVILDVDHST